MLFRSKKREKILADLATGDIQILVGTHAILEARSSFDMKKIYEILEAGI